MALRRSKGRVAMAAKRPDPRPSIVAALFWAALSVGCATVNSGSFADEFTDFSAFRSFSWINADPFIESDASQRPSASVRSMIETGIREQLQQKGYVFTTERDDADILVAYTVGTRDRISMEAYPVGYRGHWGWHEPYEHYFFRDASLTNYTPGTLGVDIFDNETGRPVWHGWAQNTVPEDDREQPGSMIAERIDRLFAALPH